MGLFALLMACGGREAVPTVRSSLEGELRIHNATDMALCHAWLKPAEQQRRARQDVLAPIKRLPAGGQATLAMPLGTWSLHLVACDGTTLGRYAELVVRGRRHVRLQQLEVPRLPGWKQRIRYAGPRLSVTQPAAL